MPGGIRHILSRRLGPQSAGQAPRLGFITPTASPPSLTDSHVGRSVSSQRRYGGFATLDRVNVVVLHKESVTVGCAVHLE